MKITKSLSFVIITSLYLVAGSKINAQEVIFSDNFDDGDFSDWTVQRSMQWQNPTSPCLYQSQPASWSLVNGELGITIDGPGCVTEITPSQLDLTNIRSFDYEFDWNFKESTNMDRNVIFLWKDSDSWYDLKIIGNSILIQKIVDGKGYFFPNNTGNYNFTANNIFHFKISYLAGEKNKILVEVNGQKVIEAIEEGPSIEGYKTLGLQASSGAIRRSSSYFDNIVVRNLDVPAQDGTQLNYEHFKQTDPQWKSEIYDSATSWSINPTINRWGCAVTSLAMIMNYHGLTTMPDGSPVNPSTLNAWLKTQSDGYIGEGLTNWIAATRLTRLISEQYNTVKLEYRRESDTTITTAGNEIMAQKPSILQIPGHFLTVNGVTGNGQDLYIKDPAYNYAKFSEHNQPILSTRTFQPSHTDLSYLLLAHQPTLHVNITDAQGNEVAGWEKFTDYLQDPVDGSNEQTSPTTLQQLAKPSPGTYLLTISQATFGPFAMQLFAYDQGANLTDLSQSGYVGTKPLTFTLEYHADGSSSLSRQMNFSQFRQDLLLMKDQKQFRQIAAYTVMDKMAAWGEASEVTDRQSHYAQLLTILVKAQRHLMTKTGFSYLLQQVTALHETF